MKLLWIVEVSSRVDNSQSKQLKFEDLFKKKQQKWISDIQVYVLHHPNDCYVKFNVSEEMCMKRCASTFPTCKKNNYSMIITMINKINKLTVYQIFQPSGTASLYGGPGSAENSRQA